MLTSNAFPIDIAQLVVLFLECILYGLYLTTFGACLRILLGLAQRRWLFVLVALILFTVATLDIATLHILDAFIYFGGPGGAKVGLADLLH